MNSIQLYSYIQYIYRPVGLKYLSIQKNSQIDLRACMNFVILSYMYHMSRSLVTVHATIHWVEQDPIHRVIYSCRSTCTIYTSSVCEIESFIGPQILSMAYQTTIHELGVLCYVTSTLMVAYLCRTSIWLALGVERVENIHHVPPCGCKDKC